MDVETALLVVSAWSTKLNASERILRQEVGDDAVDDLIRKFQEMQAINPLLFTEFTKQEHPYRFAYDIVHSGKASRLN